MDFNNYQEEAFTFAKYPSGKVEGNSCSWLYPAMALAEEAGEVAGKFAKAVRDKEGFLSEEDKKEIGKELGDCLWQISAIAYELNFKLEDIALNNIHKLEDRRARNVISGNGDNR